MISDNVKKLIQDTERLAAKHQVNMNISNARIVTLRDGTNVNGYFDANGARREFGVATGQSEEKWVPILIHESCHMDQWIDSLNDKNSIWSKSIVDSYNSEELIALWMNGRIELNDVQLAKYISSTRNVELDCEIRTVEKIKQYGIDIDTITYTQKANAYVWFYTMIQRSRKWYDIEKEPYNLEHIWSMMPTHFMTNDEYSTMPDKIEDAFSSIIS